MPANNAAGWRSDIATLTVLTTLALASRLYGLDQAPLTGDEIYTVDYAADRMRSIINPAYYALTVLSFKLFGVSEFSARFPAMLLGVTGIPVFFVTWRHLIGRNAAVIGSLLIIFSAWHLWHSQFSRFYSGVFLFGSLSYYLFYRALLRDDLWRLGGALSSAAIAFLFHATAVMIPVTFAAYALLLTFLEKPSRTELSRRVARIYLILCAFVAIAAIPVLWSVWEGRQSRGVTWGDGPGEMMLQIVHHVQLPIAVAAFFGLIIQLRNNFWMGAYFFTGIALPALFVIIAAIFLNSRSVYLFYALPLFIAMAAVLCEESRRAFVNQPRLVSYSFTALLIATLTPDFLSHYSGRRSLDVRTAVRYIEARRHPDDVVLSFPIEFDYYAREKYPVIHAPGNPRVTREDRPARIMSAIHGHDHAWIIVNSGRKPLARDLETWLGKHASLVWRRSETRFDYLVRGYEIYRVNIGSLSGDNS